MISTTFSTRTQFFPPKAAHAKGALFLTLVLISFFTIGVAHRVGRKSPTDLRIATTKLGEELSIALRLHEHPQMARALSPALNVPIHRFSDLTTELVIKFNQEPSLESIQVLERRGIEFHRMENQIVHMATIYTATVPWRLILDLAGREDVLKIEWGFKKYHPMLERSLPEIGADKVHAGIDFNRPLDGEGVTIGMVDTGVYWAHPAFWRPDPAYKYSIVVVNDQLYADIDGTGDYSSADKPLHFVGPTGQIAEFLELDRSQFNFGYDYILLGGPSLNPPSTKPPLNQPWSGSFWAIPGDENGNRKIEEGEHVIGLFSCKIRAFLNDTTGVVAERQPDGWFHADSKLFGDQAGHGTHVAATGVGGQRGYSAFTGVAPGADLVMSSTTWYLEDMIREVNWVIRQGVDVLNLSFGSLFDGALDGTSLFEQIIDRLFEDQGVLTVVAAGNDNENKVHAMGVIPSGQPSTYRFITYDPTSFKLREYFPDYPKGSFFVINALWEGEADLSFQVITPTGKISLGSYSDPRTGLNSVLNATWSAASNFESPEKYMSRFYAPFMENISLSDSKIGTGFSVEVNNPSPEDVTVHLYLAGDRGASGSWLAHWQETDPALHTGYLISSPATASRAIAVTSFVSTEWDDATSSNGYKSNPVGEISKFASRGPRVDEVVKPNIAAPGELIFAAAARDAFFDVSTADLVGLWGTSMATPHVAGTIALILEAFPELKNPASEIRDALYENVNLVDVEGPRPNPIWGFGKLDTYETTHSLIEQGFTLAPSTKTVETSPTLFVPGFEPIMTFSALAVTAFLVNKKRKRS